MAANVFLKLEGIEGSSTVAGQESKIEVQSWQHGFDQPTTPVKSSSGGGTVEKANHHNLNFTKMVDDATPQILKSCWSGKYIPTAEIAFLRSDGETEVQYLTIEMEDVIVSNYEISGGEGGIPIEDISLTYSKITYTYLGMDSAGNVGGNIPTSHDLRSNVVE